MKSFFREPLVHFLLAGGMLYALYTLVAHPTDSAVDRIVITRGVMESLDSGFEATNQRKPTPEESRGLVRDYLREEVSVREARKLGLDRDDVVIRERLASKLDFLVRDTFAIPEPTETELKNFYESHLNRFALPARISYMQITFSKNRRKTPLEDAQHALEALAGKGEAEELAELGDGYSSDTVVHGAKEKELTERYGEAFAHRLFSLPTGTWQGPIETDADFVLVRISKLEPATQYQFDEVRNVVEELWRKQRVQRDVDTHLTQLLRKYEILDDQLKPLAVVPFEQAETELAQ